MSSVNRPQVEMQPGVEGGPDGDFKAIPKHGKEPFEESATSNRALHKGVGERRGCAGMGEAETPLKDGEKLKPVRLRDECKMVDGKVTMGASVGCCGGPCAQSTFVEYRTDALVPDQLHEGGDRESGPEKHVGIDLMQN